MKRLSLLLFFFSIYIVLSFAIAQKSANINEIQSKGLNERQQEAVKEQRNLELKYNVKRGIRPPIDLEKVSPDSYEKGKLLIKLKPYLHQELDTEYIKAEKSDYVKTGISSLDEINEKIGAVQYKRQLDVLYKVSPASEKYKERHKAWGVHLWREVTFDEKFDVIEAVKMFEALPEIEIAEPVYIIRLIEPVESTPIDLNMDNTEIKWAPNDPYYANNQWHFNNTGQDIGQTGTPGWDCNAEAAWEIEKGNPNFIVAIIDQGVEYTHPDLAANIWPDIGPEGTNTEAGSHGTHVAGTVSAVTNNSVGVAGLSGGDGSGNGALIMSIDLWGNSGLTNLGMNMYAADNGASISQNSWGYDEPGVYNQSALDGIDYFNDNGGGAGLDGGITIFAAGNDNDNGQWYPAYYGYNDPDVLGAMAVASHDNRGNKSDFSNYGAWVDITAPGTNVASTDVPSDYTFKSGTSMACPHVSGVAALIVSNTQGVLTNEQLWDILVNSVRVDLYDENPGYAGELGIGALDAAAALEEAQTYLGGVPNPENFIATAVSTTQINLNWDLNEYNDEVLVAYAVAGNDIGDPVNGETYSVGNTLSGGGTVIFAGNANSYNHIELQQDEPYTYKIWSIAAEERQDEQGEWYMEGDYSSGLGAAANTFSGWIHWDDNNNAGSVGSGSARTYSIASRWEPSDIDAYDGFGITKVRVYINDQANNATVKIWQGTDSENLTEYVSQPFTQQTNTWVEVELENSYYIDASEELWFGVEYDDPGDGVYPLGRDAGPEVPGKGNMILWDGSWIELTDLNIALTYNWNLQALLAMPSGTLYTLSLETNPNDGGNPSGAGNYEEATNVLINANTAENYNFINWTIGGNEISTQEDYYYTMPNYNVTITANYEEQIVEYNLALVANPPEGGNPSGDGSYEEGESVLINANTSEDYNFVNWTIGGNEISTQEDYYYTMPDYDVSMVANYEEKSTSISEYEITDYDFDIFPNPNKGSFNVSLELPVATNIELELYDVLGRKVFNLPPETLNKGNNQITVNRQADLQNGLYILRVNAYEIDTNQFIFRNDMKILVK